LHAYVIVFGYVVLVALTVPLVGAVAPEHVTAAQVGAMPANEPFAWHTRDAVPTSE
jgi:hypothetical protein